MARRVDQRRVHLPSPVLVACLPQGPCELVEHRGAGVGRTQRHCAPVERGSPGIVVLAPLRAGRRLGECVRFRRNDIDGRAVSIGQLSLGPSVRRRVRANQDRHAWFGKRGAQSSWELVSGRPLPVDSLHEVLPVAQFLFHGAGRDVGAALDAFAKALLCDHAILQPGAYADNRQQQSR